MGCDQEDHRSLFPHGQIVIIKKIDSSANACTIAGNGKTMDGASSLSLGTQYQVERLQYNGTSWSAI
jgi:hypothetical protein